MPDNRRGPSMPPPGAKGPAVMVAVGMPKGGPKGAAPDQNGAGGKVSREKALFVEEGNHCKDCTMYTPETGECSKVEGYMEPEDACLRYFEPLGGHEEPDADEQGGQSDNDADDMPGYGKGQ